MRESSHSTKWKEDIAQSIEHSKKSQKGIRTGQRRRCVKGKGKHKGEGRQRRKEGHNLHPKDFASSAECEENYYCDPRHNSGGEKGTPLYISRTKGNRRWQEGKRGAWQQTKDWL